MTAKATLQPMRRFAFDAAIVFADILLIPMALGQAVWFEAGEGPRLGRLPELSVLRGHLDEIELTLAPVAETLRLVRGALEPERALIGFAGGPWTVATYMLEGRGGDRVGARSAVFSDPDRVDRLIDVLVEASARYLGMQVRAGAQVLQLFESWAELLPEDVFEQVVTAPHARIVARLREMGVHAPVIGFPRGAGALVEDYATGANVQGIGLDVQAPADLGRRLQAEGLAIQGALDPLLLRAGGPLLDARVERLLDQWGEGRYIFNLGHGVLPDTPIENIERVVRRVTGS
jgi:uroporphyrinogen decarboxylase